MCRAFASFLFRAEAWAEAKIRTMASAMILMKDSLFEAGARGAGSPGAGIKANQDAPKRPVIDQGYGRLTNCAMMQ